MNPADGLLKEKEDNENLVKPRHERFSKKSGGKKNEMDSR